MNERIRELAREAGFVMWGDESWNPGDVVDWSSSYDNELKKFAELIVRECINATGNCAGTGNMIKEHFGVEE
jgi:hypothetical protein